MLRPPIDWPASHLSRPGCPSARRRPRVLAFATLGAGSNEEARIATLLSRFDPEVYPFDRAAKRRCFRELLRRILRERPDLVVMEGTGLAGGLALILGRLLVGAPYVVSSGDAVGPWVASCCRWLGPAFGLYERVLYRLAAGFIGWTPYLVGRALAFGTPRAMTAAGWAPCTLTPEERVAARQQTRDRLEAPPECLLVGIVGSLAWNRRHRYCYGLELIRAAHAVRRHDLKILIVGDGDGRPRLERLAADLPAGRVVFTGRVGQDQLPQYYAALDVASLPQSTDGVGSYRYTTKLSEYLASGLPVVTGQIPLAYDLDGGWLWRLPGSAPWDPIYVAALARLLDGLTPDAVAVRRQAIPPRPREFDREAQVERATAFLLDLLGESRSP